MIQNTGKLDPDSPIRHSELAMTPKIRGGGGQRLKKKGNKGGGGWRIGLVEENGVESFRPTFVWEKSIKGFFLSRSRW